VGVSWYCILKRKIVRFINIPRIIVPRLFWWSTALPEFAFWRLWFCGHKVMRSLPWHTFQHRWSATASGFSIDTNFALMRCTFAFPRTTTLCHSVNDFRLWSCLCSVVATEKLAMIHRRNASRLDPAQITDYVFFWSWHIIIFLWLNCISDLVDLISDFFFMVISFDDWNGLGI
jgi:hypothetical protein